MNRLWREHPGLTSAFLGASAVTLFFAVRLTASLIYWSNPAHQNVEVKPWMTVGYIGRSWGVNPRELDVMAGLPVPDDRGPRTLAETAKERGVPVEELIKKVDEAITVLKQRKEAK
jgi:CHAD domain-containing protein